MSPIILKSYKWDETRKNVKIIIPFEGISKHKSDVFITNNYIKINQTPYLWEMFLKHEIDEEKSSAKISKGKIELILTKKESVIWNEVSKTCSDDKLALIKHRRAQNSKMQELEKDKTEKRAQRNQELCNTAIKEQIKAEKAEKNRIDEAVTKLKTDAFKTILMQDTHQYQLSTTHIHPVSASTPPVRKRTTVSVQFTPRLTLSQTVQSYKN